MITEPTKQLIRDKLSAISAAMPGFRSRPAQRLMIGMRGEPRPSDLVAKQPLGEADELGRGRKARLTQRACL